jgi:hypothetical protein
MEKLKLQFQTPQDFQGFRKMVPDSIVSVNIAELTITCTCTKEEIAYAMGRFDAKVIETIKDDLQPE